MLSFRLCSNRNVWRSKENRKRWNVLFLENRWIKNCWWNDRLPSRLSWKIPNYINRRWSSRRRLGWMEKINRQIRRQNSTSWWWPICNKYQEITKRTRLKNSKQYINQTKPNRNINRNIRRNRTCKEKWIHSCSIS